MSTKMKNVDNNNEKKKTQRPTKPHTHRILNETHSVGGTSSWIYFMCVLYLISFHWVFGCCCCCWLFFHFFFFLLFAFFFLFHSVIFNSNLLTYIFVSAEITFWMIIILVIVVDVRCDWNLKKKTVYTLRCMWIWFFENTTFFFVFSTQFP